MHDDNNNNDNENNNYYYYKLTLPVLILLQSAPFSTKHFTISKGPSLADQWSGVQWYYDINIMLW